MLRIEFDPAKDARNRAKHGVGLAEYALIDAAATVATEVVRSGERRTVILAPLGGRIHQAVVTFRGDAVRVISLRKANKREVRLYAKARAR